uniref:Zinc finger MYM-type protein 1-like n=1 Tax=Tanacetum cinerariifolium TaxID=118510 RepID=A0A6L2LNA3_TANCI|nr:zinc finger MYM-type protein 1-like [Tanacetum cinerariifolium]
MGIMPTEMELILEQTQQGISHEVSISAEGGEEWKIKVKIKGDIKEALFTLKAETSAAAKPCQGNSSEFYLITSSIYTDQRETVVIATIFDEVTKTLSSIYEIIGITDKLYKALQNKSQDIVNALTLVSTTKTLIQELRDDGWKSLLDKVVCFYEKYNIPVLDMNVTYREIIQSRHKKDNVTVEHHYRVDVFIVAIDTTSERAFSKMKLVKTRLRSTMSDGFLKSSMILSVEKEIVRTICTNNVIDDFYSKTQRRVQMKKRKVSS